MLSSGWLALFSSPLRLCSSGFPLCIRCLCGLSRDEAHMFRRCPIPGRSSCWNPLIPGRASLECLLGGRPSRNGEILRCCLGRRVVYRRLQKVLIANCECCINRHTASEHGECGRPRSRIRQKQWNHPSPKRTPLLSRGCWKAGSNVNGEASKGLAWRRASPLAGPNQRSCVLGRPRGVSLRHQHALRTCCAWRSVAQPG